MEQAATGQLLIVYNIYDGKKSTLYSQGTLNSAPAWSPDPRRHSVRLFRARAISPSPLVPFCRRRRRVAEHTNRAPGAVVSPGAATPGLARQVGDVGDGFSGDAGAASSRTAVGRRIRDAPPL